MSEDGLRACEEKMGAAGVPEPAIANFRHYYEQLVAGESGLIAEDRIEPVGDVPDAASLPDDAATATDALRRAVVIKLNGGLGTSMGMTHAKSLLEVKHGLSFLDVTARQTLELRRRYGARLPLLLMDSFSTQEDSLAALARYDDLASDVPADFVQNKEPKIRVDDLQPVTWEANPDLEWCPPGHGDLYTALVTSGALEALLEHDFAYAFVSNSDNLGAELDPRILAWFAAERMPFLMEVIDRTEADRKGGHICAWRDGGLVLRESAQTRDEDQAAFQDTNRHRYFNANNLWLDLATLAEVMQERGNILGLPMIRNTKTVDPTDSSSPRVFQIETAMGSAISAFDGARVVHVERGRFVPVKTTNDLLVLRSDAYELTDDARVVLSSERDGGAPFVDLDPEHFKLLADFEARFPHGSPSLVDAERLGVRGDVTFGRDVVVRGSVEVTEDVPDGAVLEG